MNRRRGACGVAIVATTTGISVGDAEILFRTERKPARAVWRGSMGKRQFVNLHGHSTFSPGDGFGSPEDHVRRVAELGNPAIALTEHGNVSSHVKLERAAREAGIKPIFGCELYCETGDPSGRYKHHLTVLAMNEKGLSNLYRVVSQSWENFYYKPTTTGEMLAENSEGLIVLSGCLGGRLATALLGGKGEEEHAPDLKAAMRVASRFREVFGDRYYLEIQPHPTLEKQKVYNQNLAHLSRRLRIPLVVTGDVHYPHPDDQDIYPVLHAIDRGGRNNTVESQSQSWEYDILLAHQPTKTLHWALRQTGLGAGHCGVAIEESLAIAERCEVSLPKLKDLRFPGTADSAQVFREWIQRGWYYREMDKLSRRDQRDYWRRVNQEANLIIDKGFVDYFLVISDMVRYAKDKGIPVGPARGSAAASLVCYLLRITEIDPMKFPLMLFERFIDVNRHDIPDIDLDFDDERRHEIRDYLVRQYGEDRVGNIGTFTMYKGKNSLDDIARVNRVPGWAVDTIKEMLIERSSGDLRASATIEDTIEMFPKVRQVFEQFPVLRDSQRLEGNLKGFSVHAAGLVVANEPLTNSVAVYTRQDRKTGQRSNVLSIDKIDAEYIGALKIDVLGLLTMAVIRKCLEMIGMDLEDLYELPLDDEAVFEGFRRNEVVGVFQFDGRAMRSVNREVKPDTFAELADINALSRPGPLHSGAAAEYIMAKHGKKKIVSLNPVVDQITEHTQGQIVYQEQILRVVRELGKFSWEEAAHVRKLISKKQGEQAFNRLQSKFVDGCVKGGVPEANAYKIWKQLVTAGAYAFNFAHSCSYAVLAYWTMWLKQHHPVEFYSAALQKYDPKTKGFDLLKEAITKGIEILPPDPMASEVTWSVSESRVPRRVKRLRAGLVQIPGIGETMAARMIEYREESTTEFTDWGPYLEMKGFGPGTLRKIEDFCLNEDPFGVFKLSKTLEAARRWLWERGDENMLPFPKHQSDDVPYEARRGEYIWIGYVRQRNLKDIYELHRSRTGEELDPKKVREPQYVNYVVITGEDETGPLVITVHRYRGQYEKYKNTIWNLKPERDLLLVRGYKRNEYRRAIYASEIWVLNPEEFL